MNKKRDNYIDELYEYTRLKSGRPLNETEEHFFCKCVGQVFLFHYCNCRFISTEVSGCWHLDKNIPGHSDVLVSKQGNTYKKYDKNIIDVIGMTRKDVVYGVESKVSKSDYRNGFCAGLPYTYIICPKDVLHISDIPKDIGLIYVDIPNFHIVGYDELYGIEVVRNARKRIDARWLKPNGEFNDNSYDYHLNKWYDFICYRNTLKNTFNRTHIPIYKKKPIT
jgi:hypothetical protein